MQQFTIMQRIVKLQLNKKNVITFKFDIDDTFFIDSIRLITSIESVTFHIVSVNISFLLCLVDLNRLDIFFNNLINMIIVNRFSIDFHIDLNSRTAIDFQIDLKTSRIMIDLHIDMKKEHRSIISRIDMKKVYLVIHRYDHVFFL